MINSGYLEELQMFRYQRFGAGWTERKLNSIEEYLKSYSTALKNQPFRRIYIDAFAGSGYRANRTGEDDGGFFNIAELDALAEGSTRRALKIEPPFDEYVFIEKNRRNFTALKGIVADFPQRHGRIRFINEDANSALVDLCRSIDWRNSRAVLFLDPYGMQVDWTTIEVVAETKSIDMWYLFPSGIAITRLMPQEALVPPEWEPALDRCFGDVGWRTAFYKEEPDMPDLFGSPAKRVVKDTDIAKIEAYFIDRLKTVFSNVAPNGLRLQNSRGFYMYLLCFACSNPSPRASRLALKLANAVLKDKD